MESSSNAGVATGNPQSNGHVDYAKRAGDASFAKPLCDLPAPALWHSSAPSGLRAVWKSDPHSGGWKRLAKLIADRAAPKPLRAAAKSDASPLAWGAEGTPAAWTPWRAALRSRPAYDDVALLGDRPLGDLIDEWLAADHGDALRADFCLECLWWAYEAPAIAQVVDSRTWWRLTQRLYEVAVQAIESRPGEGASGERALANQMLGGELPLVLGLLLSEAQPLRRLRNASSAVLTEGVLALTDGEGMVTAGVIDKLPALLACWTRCRAWSDESGKPCWGGEAETQYEWLVRQSLRLSRTDGSLAFASQHTLGAKPLLDLALDLAGDVSDHAAAGLRLRCKEYGKIAGRAAPPESSVNADWSGISVLAAGWAAKDQRAVVTYAGRDSRLEYAAGGACLISGEWATEVTIDGQRLAPAADWEELCWYSDDECAYLELNLDLERGARLQRQIALAREDRVAYLSDIVLSGRKEPAEIRLVTRLPLHDGATFAASDETREGWLAVGEKRLAGVVPAGLPEWRVDPRGGELSEEDGVLTLRVTQHGRNLCSPLFLDAAPARFAKQCTWRQLTVAQALRRVNPDVAVAYRFQSGKDQWIAYRSLDAPANRTFVGHNLSTECVFGRFLRSGELDELFEIEDE